MSPVNSPIHSLDVEIQMDPEGKGVLKQDAAGSVLIAHAESAPMTSKSKIIGLLTFISVLIFLAAVDLSIYALRINYLKIHHVDVLLAADSSSCLDDVPCLSNSQVHVHQNIPTSSAFFSYDLSSISTCQLTTPVIDKTVKEQDKTLVTFKPSLSSISTSDSSIFEFGGVKSTMKLDVGDPDFKELTSFTNELLKKQNEDTRKRKKVTYSCELQLDVLFLHNKGLKLFNSPKTSVKNSVDVSKLILSVDGPFSMLNTTANAMTEVHQREGMAGLDSFTYPVNQQLSIPEKTQRAISENLGYVTVSVPRTAVSSAPLKFSTTLQKQQHTFEMSMQPFTMDSRDLRVQTDIELSCYMSTDKDRRCTLFSPGVDAYTTLTGLRDEGASVEFDIELQSDSALLEQAVGANHKIGINRRSAASMSSGRRLIPELLDKCITMDWDDARFAQLCNKKKEATSASLKNLADDNIINEDLDLDLTIPLIEIDIATSLVIVVDSNSASIKIDKDYRITAEMRKSLGDCAVEDILLRDCIPKAASGELSVELLAPDLIMEMTLQGSFANDDEGLRVGVVSYLKDTTDVNDVYVWYDIAMAGGAHTLEKTQKEGAISGLGVYIDSARLVLMDTEVMDSEMFLDVYLTEDGMRGDINMYVRDTHNDENRFYLVQNMGWYMAEDLTEMRMRWSSIVWLLGKEYMSAIMSVAYDPTSFKLSVDDDLMDLRASLEARWEFSNLMDWDSSATVKVAMHLAEEANMDMQWYIDTSGTSIDDLAVTFDAKMVEQMKMLGQETKPEIMRMNSTVMMEPNKMMKVNMNVDTTMVDSKTEMSNDEAKHPEYFLSYFTEVVTAIEDTDMVDVQNDVMHYAESFGLDLDVIAYPALYVAYELARFLNVIDAAGELGTMVLTEDNSKQINEYQISTTMTISPLAVVIPEPPTMVPTGAAVADMDISQTLTGLKFSDYSKDPKAGRQIITSSILAALPADFTVDNIQNLLVLSQGLSNGRSRWSLQIADDTVVTYTIVIYPDNAVESIEALKDSFTEYVESAQFSQTMANKADELSVPGYSNVESAVDVEEVRITTESPTVGESVKSSDGNDPDLVMIIVLVIAALLGCGGCIGFYMFFYLSEKSPTAPTVYIAANVEAVEVVSVSNTELAL